MLLLPFRELVNSKKTVPFSHSVLDLRHSNSSFVRFLFTGGLNTILTIAIYQLLLFVVSPSSAYGISWGIGLVYVALCYPKIVFQKKMTFANIAKTIFVYLSIFILGLVCTNYLVLLSVPPRLVIFIVIVITVAFNFLILKKIIK